jgi:hypothetical protein
MSDGPQSACRVVLSLVPLGPGFNILDATKRYPFRQSGQYFSLGRRERNHGTVLCCSVIEFVLRIGGSSEPQVMSGAGRGSIKWRQTWSWHRPTARVIASVPSCRRSTRAACVLWCVKQVSCVPTVDRRTVLPREVGEVIAHFVVAPLAGGELAQLSGDALQLAQSIRSSWKHAPSRVMCSGVTVWQWRVPRPTRPHILTGCVGPRERRKNTRVSCEHLACGTVGKVRKRKPPSQELPYQRQSVCICVRTDTRHPYQKPCRGFLVEGACGQTANGRDVVLLLSESESIGPSVGRGSVGSVTGLEGWCRSRRRISVGDRRRYPNGRTGG